MRRRGLLDAVELHEAVLAEASEQLSVVRALGIEEEGYEEVLKHRPLVVALLAVTERCEKSGRALDRRALELRAARKSSGPSSCTPERLCGNAEAPQLLPPPPVPSTHPSNAGASMLPEVSRK